MELDFWQIMLLAGIQGATEFLPVSSSGHLVIAEALMAAENPQALEAGDINIGLHVGTLVSVLVYYWKRIWQLLFEDRRLIGLLAAGTVPAVIVGLPIELFFDELLGSPVIAGIFLPITGLVLLWGTRHGRGSLACQRMTYRQALIVGLAQAAAIMPGLSRSGTTIAAGLGQGLEPKSAATFSFLLAIPTIAGAAVLSGIKLTLGGGDLSVRPSWLAMGAVVSFVVGLAAINVLVRWLEKGRLFLFAYWCIPVGIGVLIWQLQHYRS